MRRALALAALFLLLGSAALAEGMEKAVEALPLEELEAFARENGVALDVRALIGQLTAGGAADRAEPLLASLRAMLGAALKEALPSALTLTAPALLWALGRQLTGGGRLGAASELVCALSEASLLAGLYAGQADAARASLERIAGLIGRFHPVVSALLSACGAPGLAGLMAPAGALATGLIARVMTGAVLSLSAAAAVLAAADGLGQLTLTGLFKLCVSTANWLLGGATTLFLGLMTAGGLLERGRDGMALRAAEYAVDSLLPVIGGDVADTLGAAASGAALLRGAVGVTGAALLTGVCLGPMLRLLASIWGCRLAAALAQPVAEGPLIRCLNGFADAMRLLFLAQAACTVLFLAIAGAGVAAGGALMGT